jgi:hypothetical protein
MSEKPIRSDLTPTAARGPRDSEVRMRESEEPAQVELRRVRKRAVTLRSHGWKWEIQGRAAAFREAADQVRKWLLDKGAPPTENEIRFVVQLLEQSAEVYEAADDPDEKGR